mgnify:CR=1 FL=1
MFEYSFNVKDVQEIDLDRILLEQHDDNHDVSLVTSENGNRYLLVHNDFLSQFKFADEIRLNQSSLNPIWGFSLLEVGYKSRGFSLNDKGEFLKQGRWLPVRSSVPEIKKELDHARAFIRKIKVNVHSL